MVAIKASDTARSSTTTTAADPELQFSVLANAVYVMDGWLKVSGDATGDINLDWSPPTGSTGEWMGHGPGNNVISATGGPGVLAADTAETRGYMVRLESNDIAAARSFGLITSTDLLTIVLNGTLRVGSSDGTYSLDWAQVSSVATATTIYADSWIRLQRIA
jgi:hypothetical protein